MEKKKAEYRSSIRSKRMIKQAFLSLIKEKDISKITVTELVERADLNRATFYAHYPDIYGVLEEYEDEAVQFMLSVLNEFEYNSFLQNPTPVLLKINRQLEGDLDFYRIMIASKSSESFLEKLKNIFVEYMSQDESVPASIRSSVQFEMRLHFFAGGIINMYKQWFSGRLKGSLNDISVEIGKIITGTPTSAVQ